jgi:murein L,D-transpeptidase YafK
MTPRRLGLSFVLVVGLTSGLWLYGAGHGAGPATGSPLEKALGARPDLRKISLKIEKSAYRLTVLYDGRAVKEYPVVFGRNPVDDKLREGDGCTPEGEFKIVAHRASKYWNKFLHLNYPNARSWERFRNAKKAGKVRAKATIGGGVGIHGSPEGHDDYIDKRINWTAGCISMKNADVEELYRFTRVGTPVMVLH